MSHKTFDGKLGNTTNRIREIPAAEVKAMIERGEKNVYLDVREAKEYNLGHLPNAVHVPLGVLELRVEEAVPRDATVVAYCSAGVRSAMAAKTLQAMGYTDVVSMTGGLRDYVPTGGPIEG
jgi:rhodanese-related sulfurtransferase